MSINKIIVKSNEKFSLTFFQFVIVTYYVNIIQIIQFIIK